MAIHRFRLLDEYIELNKLLKITAIASSGGAAKALITDGRVRVDGVPEQRIRRKLRAGQTVQVANEEVRIVATDEPPLQTESDPQ